MINGALYLRVSTKEQAQKKTSIEAQERALREYVLDNNINVSCVYIDDGYSGTTTQRPEFQRMLTEAHSEKFKVILVWKYDRFARNLIDQEITILELQKLNVLVKSITENDDVLLRRIRGAINEDEITKTLERSRLVKEDRARQGYHLGRAPFGYDFDQLTHELILNDDAPKVKAIFTKKESNVNVSQIAKEYGFTRQGIYNILNNPIYRGFVKYQGRLIKGRHEAML